VGHTEGIHRVSAGPSGNGDPCVDSGCTVSTDAAKMGQLKVTSTAIMTVSRHEEKVVRSLTTAGVGSFASWRLFQLAPITRVASLLAGGWGQ
jgi:hypothetical protein